MNKLKQVYLKKSKTSDILEFLSELNINKIILIGSFNDNQVCKIKEILKSKELLCASDMANNTKTILLSLDDAKKIEEILEEIKEFLICKRFENLNDYDCFLNCKILYGKTLAKLINISKFTDLVIDRCSDLDIYINYNANVYDSKKIKENCDTFFKNSLLQSKNY